MFKYLSLSFTGTMNFNAKHGCTKCTEEGEWSHAAHTMVFANNTAALRTDQDFRSGKYMGKHQAKHTPLLDLPIDMIQDFPIGDCLHLLDLGITKRLLMGWIEGSLSNVDAKWSTHEKSIVSGFLSDIKAPAEIRAQRNVRNFTEVKKWKAIEFRNSGLYLGCAVLKGNLRDYIFKHFLLYFVSMTIFSSEYHLKRLFEVGKKCLNVFVERYKVIYGKQYFTSNVHNLVHLSEDVKRFGPLGTFSAYPFESKLFNVGRLLRTGNLPLSQAAKRIIETDSTEISCNSPNIKKPVIKYCRTTKIDKLDNILDSTYNLYSYLEMPRFKIYCDREEDKWVLLKSSSILEIQHIILYMGRISIYGHTLKFAQDYFDLPIKSSQLFIFSAEQ